ncbi:hemicentin-1-like isoform X1 [Lytechinus variegatus]|uniref:hemicentin-1-like isoform X1 n=1 Tax=Lytechinus variegatus TaxID=7654 RepID=UPI001BB1F582|nr:hemicentin-1-like isoform X1 [Lytechinus variegatus]XP_041471094.1 hemicentin-1-like isoform X1 [Lytechinus variegatus]
MATTVYYKFFIISFLSLLWRPWSHLVIDAQQTVVSTPENLSVKEGETVTLVCNYEPKTDELYFGSLSWQMGSSVLAAHSCPNACSRTNQNTDHYSLDVDLISSGNLTIRDASLEDDNVYECKVTSFYGSAGSTSRLIVNVPPVSLKLSDTMTPAGHQQGDIVPVLSGQTYTITCTTEPGANPPVDLEWTSTTAQITEEDQVDQPVTASKLTVSSREVTFTASMADHLTAVTCEATHPALATSLTKFIQLDVQVPPKNVNIAYNSVIISDGGTLTLDEGTSNTITCESLGTRPASAITWYLDGVQVASGIGRPVFTPNANDSRLQDASSSIIIQPSREHHEQVLRCQATTFGISRDVSIRLSIDGPPDPPVISGIPDTLNENQQTSITCEADNGHPSPSFQWFIGTRNLSADATLQVSADASNRIDALSQLRYLPLREDNGLALQCNVIHDQLSQPMKVMSDNLVVNYCPTTVEVTICPEVEAGSSKLMVCRSGPSNPASNLVWIQGVETINEPDALQTHFEESSEPQGSRTTLSYMRNFTKQDYRQSFKCCTTVSPSCDSTVCSEPCVPNVKYAPEEPVISRNMPARQVTEGTADLEFTCRAEGNPRPALTWVMASNEGLMLDQLTKEDGSQLLRFREVRRHHAGVYRCIANNNIPPRSSNQDQLIVLFPPTIQNKANNRTTTNEGKNATLSCVVKGNPSIRVNWERLGNHSDELWDRTLVVNTVVNSDYESVVTSTLSVLNVQPDIDHGNYRCTAENTIGVDEAVINLSGTSKPEPPTSLRVDASRTTSHSFMAYWQPGFDGGVEQSYVIMYCLNDTQMDCKNIFGIKEPEYLLEELQDFRWYSISVYAENTNGRSIGSSKIVVSTAPLPPSGYGILVTNENGLITLASDPAIELPDGIGFKIETSAEGHCNPKSRAYPADGAPVQRPSDQVIMVSSFGRGLCSVQETVNVASLNTGNRGQSPITFAIIGIVVFIALVFVILVVRRNHIRKNELKLPKSSIRSGPEGQPTNGQSRSFLSGGYFAYNPVYDDVAKEDFRKSQHEGRIVNEDGLIYAEVAHVKNHPKDQPPIRTEEATIYASLDFNKMDDAKKQQEKQPVVDSNRNAEDCPEKEALIYENVTPQGLPVSP